MKFRFRFYMPIIFKDQKEKHFIDHDIKAFNLNDAYHKATEWAKRNHYIDYDYLGAN